MTSNTKLSNLSIAAIALLAASAPCFAQPQSAESRGETSNVVAMANPELPVPFNGPQLETAEPRLGIFNAEPKSVAAVVSSEKQPSLSPAAFKMRTDQSSSVKNKLFFGQQTTIYDMGLGNSKTQFRADDYNSAVDQKKRVSFVPSRGPKMPGEEWKAR